MIAEQYYAILGLKSGTTISKEELKKVYKQLALKYHPDRGGDEEHFKKINEAYDYVTGKRKPSRYEQQQEARRREQQRQQQRKKVEYQQPRPYYRPKKRRPKRMVERWVEDYVRCQECRGEGRWVTYCRWCYGTGNEVGYNEHKSVKLSRCGCRNGIESVAYCQTCGGAGRISVGKRKIIKWI